MKKVFGVMLCLCLAMGVLYAQKPQAERLNAYDKLEEQRQDLLNWQKEHFYATYWAKEERQEQAKEVRRQQHEQYRDVELWILQQSQSQIRQINADLKEEVAFVKHNLFPAENLNSLAKDQPELFKELMKLYPENLGQTDAQVLLPLLAEDEAFAAYINDYVMYLKNYALYPQCVEEMPSYYKSQLQVSKERHNRYSQMAALARGCRDYADEKWQQQLTQRELEKTLQYVKR